MRLRPSISVVCAWVFVFGWTTSFIAADEKSETPRAKPALKAKLKVAPLVRLVEAAAEKQTGEGPANTEEPTSSHAVTSEIKVSGTDGNTKLQTICVDQDGRVLGLVAAPRGYDAKASGGGEVHVFDADGAPVTHWNVDFAAHSINTDPDGNVFVAGDGRVAKFARDGKLLKELALPHIAELLKNKVGLREQAEAQVKSQREAFERNIKTYQDRLAQLEAKDEAQLSKTEQTQLAQYKLILKQQEQQGEYYKSLTVESVLSDTTRRLRIINAIAIGVRDVFIVCGESKGYGFAIWRTDHEFQDAQQVMSGVRGCCGQMDVQVQGDDFLVAENTQHRFARYDRDGKELGHGGSRGLETAPGCFGGCCNPMNVRAGLNGDVFTTESEGIVKRFSAEGDYLGLVGKSSLTGGCKNVAVGVSPDAKRVYFCDQPGSRIVVLTQKPPATAKAE